MRVTQTLFNANRSLGKTLLLFLAMAMIVTLSISRVAATASTLSPDLTIESITFNPPNPNVGDPVDIVVTVKNIGTVASIGGRLRLYVDPIDQPPTTSTPHTSHSYIGISIAAGGTFQYTRTGHVFTGNTNHEIYGWIDVDNEVAESDENNNLFHVTLPMGGYDFPDLVISSVAIELESNDCYSGAILGTRVTISNIGTANAGPFVLTVNGVDLQIPGLAVNGQDSFWFAGNTNPTSVTVDTYSEVQESNENNNSFYDNVPVPTLPPACPTETPTPTDIPPTNTPTPSPTPTHYATVTPTPTNTPTPSPTPTRYATVIPTIVPTPSRAYDDGSNNNCAGAKAIDEGIFYGEDLQPSADEDWFKFDAIVGVEYEVAVTGIGNDADLAIELYVQASAGYCVGNLSPISTSVLFTANETGTHYFRVLHNQLTYGPDTRYTIHYKSIGGDIYEGSNDDAPNNTVPQIRFDDEQRHDLFPVGDRDYVQLFLEGGMNYNIWAVPASGDTGSEADPSVSIYGSFGEIGSSIDFTAPESGVYYIEVTHNNLTYDATKSSYCLKVQSGENPTEPICPGIADTPTQVGFDSQSADRNFLTIGSAALLMTLLAITTWGWHRRQTSDL